MLEAVGRADARTPLRCEHRELVEQARLPDAGPAPCYGGGAAAGLGAPVQVVEALQLGASSNQRTPRSAWPSSVHSTMHAVPRWAMLMVNDFLLIRRTTP